jgi:adenylate cyclase
VFESRIAIWGLLSVAAGLVGWGYSTLVGGTTYIGLITGLLIGASILGLELFVIQRRIGAPLRRMPLPIFVLVTTLAWLVLLSACLAGVPYVMIGAAYGGSYTTTTFTQDLSFAFFASLIFSGALRVRSLAGPRVFANFLLGRYHRPLREQRIFMFLDLADSTALAERLFHRSPPRCRSRQTARLRRTLRTTSATLRKGSAPRGAATRTR